jgi:starch-binding outer membrane protein, SusD/RagB family
MKKILKFNKVWALLAVLLTLSACDEFLDRPTEDTYSIDGFYQTDEQCFQAVNILYNSPWYDFQRGWFKIGDVLAGNMYYNNLSEEFITINMTSANVDMANASNSLWLVNGHANAIIENIANKSGSGVSATTKNTVTGEAMLWKALAYFYLVRCWGAVPIIHNNSATLGTGNSNSLYKNRVEDVYEYTIRTIKKAASLLPAENESGRLNKFSAYGLLSKVYLTYSGWGQKGSRNEALLDSAKKYAGYVISNYSGTLLPVYENLFRGSYNINSECLISWRWVASDQWTSQNTLESDLALEPAFSGITDTWGTYSGPTIDLQRLFGEDPTSLIRKNNDSRRKATMMMYGDYYPYWWRDKGGFTATWVNGDGNVAGATFGSITGANCVKHIVGNNADHNAECGVDLQRMANNLATHLLRLADVYLIYAEASLGNKASLSASEDAEALRVYNAVCARAIANWVDVDEITFKDVFDQRRKELACEAESWYDYVRLSYYAPSLAMQWINAQERGGYDAATEGSLIGYYAGINTKAQMDAKFFSRKLHVTDSTNFTLPFPDVDLALNPNLMEAPVPFDFGSIDY